MRKHFARLCVALLTFVVGLFAAGALQGRPESPVFERPAEKARVLTTSSDPALFGVTGCSLTIPETPEDKAVRLAMEFAVRNGYTNFSPEVDELSHESVGLVVDVDGIPKLRRDTLEYPPYGLQYMGRGGGPGWTVAFRRTWRGWPVDDAAGRAVTMDERFGNLRLEHRSFPLAKVHKRF